MWLYVHLIRLRKKQHKLLRSIKGTKNQRHLRRGVEERRSRGGEERRRGEKERRQEGRKREGRRRGEKRRRRRMVSVEGALARC